MLRYRGALVFFDDVTLLRLIHIQGQGTRKRHRCKVTAEQFIFVKIKGFFPLSRCHSF